MRCLVMSFLLFSLTPAAAMGFDMHAGLPIDGVFAAEAAHCDADGDGMRLDATGLNGLDWSCRFSQTWRLEEAGAYAAHAYCTSDDRPASALIMIVETGSGYRVSQVPWAAGGDAVELSHRCGDLSLLAARRQTWRNPEGETGIAVPPYGQMYFVCDETGQQSLILGFGGMIFPDMGFDGVSSTVVMAVDGAKFVLEANYFADAQTITPRVDVSRQEEFIEALKSGRELEVAVLGGSAIIPLRGSRAAIDGAMESCASQ